MRARLYSLYARDRWTIGDNLTLDFGTRWEYFPVPTRPDRGIERYDVATGKVLLCGVGDIPKDCGIKASKTRFGPRLGLAYRIGDKWVARAGYGLTNDPYEAMELIRANYPILIQVKRESPDGLTPAATLSGGIPAIQVPAEGNGVLDIPSDYAFGGTRRIWTGVYRVVESHGPAGAAVEVHGPDRLRRHAHGATARAPRHQCRPGHRRR